MFHLIANLYLKYPINQFARLRPFSSLKLDSTVNLSSTNSNTNKIPAASSASSEFRKILYHLPQLKGSPDKIVNIASPLSFLLTQNDLQAALSPLQETIDTSNYIEPTLRHLLSLSLQSKPQINKFNCMQARKFFARSLNDTGSVEVQCGQLTARMIWLGEHCAAHKHDFKSQRKIVELVAVRRKFLRYLRRISLERYYKLLDQLSLPPNYLEAFEASCSYKSKQKLGKKLK